MHRFLRLTALALLLLAPPLAGQGGDPLELLRTHAHPLERAEDLGPLVERALGRRLVLIGEASYGTREPHEWRAELTRRLIEEGEIAFIAVEGEWSRIRALDRYVRHHPDAGAGARQILDGFERWPRWLWSNRTVEEFVEWLREHNGALPEEERVALYGMDLNDPWEAIDPLLASLAAMGSEHLDAAREAVECLARHDRDPGGFIASVVEFGEESCRDEIEEVAADLTAESEADPRDLELFHAAQEARVIANATDHLLAVARAGPASWNLRVDHFHSTLERVMEKRDGAAGIVWAHNTHVGDARSSGMAVHGEESLGERVRETLGAGEVFIVGFSTYRGQVVAAPAWNAGMETMEVPPAVDGSVDALFARVGMEAFYFFPSDEPLRSGLEDPRGQRAIGIVYAPEDDAQLNYVATDLAGRYDALVFVRETTPLEVLPAR